MKARTRRLGGIPALALGLLAVGAAPAGASVDLTLPLPTGSQLAVGKTASEPIELTGDFGTSPTGNVVPCMVLTTPTGLVIVTDPFADKPGGPGN